MQSLDKLAILPPEIAQGFPTTEAVKAALGGLELSRSIGNLRLHCVTGMSGSWDRAPISLVVVAPQGVSVSLHPESRSSCVIVNTDQIVQRYDFRGVRLQVYHRQVRAVRGTLCSPDFTRFDLGKPLCRVDYTEGPDGSGPYSPTPVLALTPEGDFLTVERKPLSWVGVFAGMTVKRPGYVGLVGAVVVADPIPEDRSHT